MERKVLFGARIHWIGRENGKKTCRDRWISESMRRWDRFFYEKRRSLPVFNSCYKGYKMISSLSNRFPRTILFLAFFLSLFVGIQGPLFDWDEGAFSEASREMLESGNLITTYMNGDVRFAKPVLIYWFQTISMSIFGVNSLAVRLPSVLFTALWALAIFLFTRRLSDFRQAFYATFFFLTALQISVVGRAAISDALLNVNIAASMFLMFLYYRSGEKKYTRWAMVFIALGTLTKGPIAILIPGFVNLVYSLWQKRFVDLLKGVFDPLALFLFLILTMPWYVLQYMDQGYAFIEGFFLKHNVGRFTDPMEGHGGGLWYYIPVVLLGFMPFTGFLFRVSARIRREWSDDFFRYGILWFGSVFVFFSLSGTKLPHYVVYGYTPLFVLMARTVDEGRISRMFLAPLVLVAFLFFLPEVFQYALASTPDESFARDVLLATIPEFGATYRFLTGGVLLLFVLFFLGYPENGATRILGSGLILVLFLNGVLLSRAFRILQSPVQEAAAIAKEKKLDVSVWRLYWPSFIFYTEKLTPMKIPQEGDVLLMKRVEKKYLGKAETLYEKNGLSLVRVIRMNEDDYRRLMTR